MNNNNIHVDFSFHDRVDIGGDTVTIPITSTVAHFKKIVQTMFSFKINEYQVQYDSKLRTDNEIFANFWSTVDHKEVFFLKPSIAGECIEFM